MFRTSETEALPPLAPANDVAELSPASARAYARWRLSVERAALAGGYWDKVLALRAIEGGSARTLSNETTRIARR